MRIIRTDQTSPDSIPDPEELEDIYNGLDVCITAEVLQTLLPQLDENTRRTYEFSRALQGPALEMRLRGVLVDQRRKQEVINEYREHISQLEDQLDRIVLEGCGLATFNWRSPADQQKLFYGTLGIPPIIKKGRPTCDRAAREKLRIYLVARPILSHINAIYDLAMRIKMLTTEIDPDGRIRTSYNIAGTSTGRFSSSFSEFGTGGNLQNVEESLRSIFIADPGFKFAKFDAKSGESYCVGAKEWNLFNDGRYLDAVESGDIHTAVARICWPNLGWTGDLGRDKDIAEQPYYRHHTYRFMCKKLGHGCLTEDHEVLTRDGWVSIAEKPNSILIWDGDRSYFDRVLNWTDFEYTGALHMFEGNSISARMTSDHRIPYKKDSRQNWIDARTAADGPGTKMPLGFGYIGGNIDVPAKLIAAYMADGSQDKYGLSFHFVKQRKVERIIDLCEHYNLYYNVYYNQDGTVKVIVKSPSLPKYPGPFMFDWTQSCLQEFVDELRFWDGYEGLTSVSISSIRRETLEWFQTFGRIIGIGGNISKPYTSGFGSIVYRLQQNNRKWASGSSIEHTIEEVQNVRVICPTTSTGWFYVRRNDKIFITGNSNYGGQPKTLAEQSQLPEPVVRDFQPKYFRAFPSHIRWQGWVEDQLRRSGNLITLTGRKRWFFGRRNDPSTLREAIAYDPQGSLADLVNRAMLRIWRWSKHNCPYEVYILLHDHDALTFMYREEQEDEVVPILKSMLVEELPLLHGRTLAVPYDCATGWNKGSYDARTNPEGLKDYKGHDERRRPKEVSIMDRVILRAHG